MIYEKLIKVIEEQGVKKIDAVGKPFDVHFHEALMQRPAEGTKPHTVIEELEKGYMYKDRVIRHAKVVVSEEISAETFNKHSKEKSSEKSNSEDE
jgi:molecular chaperone GrpE